jgi:D-beta-D-heptose 7-phosphate kinase/D-beta-D-heptose 1-phosphate adenosyltransferase
VKVLLIGDSCQDIYIYGQCERLCPAAPVPVFVPVQTVSNEGMAGNVYQNFLTLGIPCDFVTNEEKISKTRYVEQKTNQMIIRVDSGEGEIVRVKNLRDIDLSQYEAVVISDYNKGFLLKEDIQYLGKNHPLVFMDTKKLLGKWCKDCEFIKINDYEHAATKHLLDACGQWMDEKLIVTRGSNGCTYRKKNFPVDKVEIRDLCGAGDTFLAGLVVEYIYSKDLKRAIGFANECATEVVQHRGVGLPIKFKGKYKK